MLTIRRTLHRLVAVTVGAAITVMAIEVLLHFYNPLPATVSKGRIVLRANSRNVFHNEQNDKLARSITVSTNSLGFRGPEPPANVADYLSILAIGGSTTHALFNTDGHTWPDLLGQRLARAFAGQSVGIWVNNAGLAGHSTFGHLVLLRDYVIDLRPSVALFLVGANDVGRDRSDQFLLFDEASSWRAQLKTFLLQRLELPGFILNVRGVLHARARGLAHDLRFKLSEQQTLTETPARREALLNQHQSRYISGYSERVRQLIEICYKNGILPVFITQPALYGPAVDPSTGIPLARIRVDGWAPARAPAGTDGATAWEILDLYNQAVVVTARAMSAPVIDLAAILPKDSRYFYDLIHPSDEGIVAFADAISGPLVEILRSRCSAGGRLSRACS